MQKTRYCWDSCVFIAILSAETRSHDELVALRDVVDAVDRGHVSMVTSTIIQAEVLDAVRDTARASRFRHILDLPNVLEESVTPGIGRRAGEIRLALRRQQRKLQAADAIFVATALVHKCVSLQTYDEQLLNLSGRPEVHGLAITKPVADQTSLALETHSDPT